MQGALAPSCACTSAVMLRAGAVVCASCSAPVLVAARPSASIYSTATGASWPPNCKTRRMARERIRQVPGHERSGTGRATVWSVDAETYRRHYSRPTRTVVKLAPVTSDDAAVEAALAASGVRMTKGRAA